MLKNTHMAAALAAAPEDQIVFDLAGIEARYDELIRELPGIAVRFAMKACPVDEVLACLAKRGAGFDAASPNEIAQAIMTGVPVGQIHYGNTIKSDQNIIDAHRLGVRDFATDSLEDVAAIAAYAPGSRVFCRLATTGDGALWGLSHKCGCSGADAVHVMERARTMGLTPSGLSVHVGSQQMTAQAWRNAFESLAEVLADLKSRGISLDHVNLGGGLPALGYRDRRGRPLHPPMDEIFDAIRTGMRQLSRESGGDLDFIVEPGRYMVADYGAIRAHVSRLSAREHLNGERQYWLYLSCGKFNGLYEMDQLQYQLVFPSHIGEEYVPAVIAGPTCDSDDAFNHEDNLVHVPKAAASGDPVWILSCGAYSTSYTTQGFNGFSPLPHTVLHGEQNGRNDLRHQQPSTGVNTLAEGPGQITGSVCVRHISDRDWDSIVALEAGAYTDCGLSEGRVALQSRARTSPATSFVLDIDQQVAGYLLAFPYPMFHYPDLIRTEETSFDSHTLHLHDLVIADGFRNQGLASHLLHHLTATAKSRMYERISLIAVAGSDTFWSANGYHPHPKVTLPKSYGADAVYMSRAI